MAQGVREYKEKSKTISDTRIAGKQLDATIKDKSKPLTEKTLKPITDKAGIDIKKVPKSKMSSSTNFLDSIKKGIDIGSDGLKTYSEVKEAIDPFINSKGGLGTFADLEKLLKTAGGFMGAFSLLSKFFKLDLTQIENLNDTSITKIAPGTTESLLGVNIPDKVNIPKFPKITEADPDRDGGEFANNISTMIENKHNQAATELSMNFGKTENKVPDIKPPAPIKFEPEPNRDKYQSQIGEFTKLIEMQQIELPKVPGASSKVEGSMTSTTLVPLRNSNLPLKSMALVLNLKLNGTTLIGKATLTLRAQTPMFDTVYNGNITTPLQISQTNQITGNFTLTRNQQYVFGEQNISFNIVEEGANVGFINTNEKTIKMNVYSTQLGMSATNSLKVEGNYEE